MCGINGIIRKNRGSNWDLADSLETMNNLIKHRGPDDEGFVLFKEDGYVTAAGDNTPKNVLEDISTEQHPITHIQNLKENYSFGFGHRRLSILDLSPSGHQPMCLQNRDTWITFNGEIYNYLEIRKELKKEGFTFKTETDTEVILNAYSFWGFNCVDRFEGMWSFVIYDDQKKIFFGSRDRMGVKPFYYYNDDFVFAFTSEQKALAPMPFVRTGINAKAVYDFFVLNTIESEEEGMFSNIMELAPAHSFTFDLTKGEFHKWKYYQLQKNSIFEDFSEVKAKIYEEELAYLIEKAVKLRLRSDVPVGACLSGGIDSSVITGIIQQQGGQNYPLQLFTASYNDSRIDESKWAEKMADRSNSKWNKVYPNASELLNDIETLNYCQDVPIWSTSTYAQYRVMKMARETGTKVVLSGQGGDELFGGYPVYLYPFYKELIVNLRPKLLLDTMAGFGGIPENLLFSTKKFVKTKALSILPFNLQSTVLKGYKKELPYLNSEFYRKHSSRLNNLKDENPANLNEALHFDLDNNLLKKYLKCEDRCSMIHSVESRIPFSDSHKLIEYALNIPSTYKIHDGYQKYILRKAAARYIPREIANRKDKMGYVTPNNAWINDIFPKIKDIFTNPVLKDYIDTDNILKNSKNLTDPHKIHENSMIFKFISFAFWIKNFETALRK